MVPTDFSMHFRHVLSALVLFSASLIAAPLPNPNWKYQTAPRLAGKLPTASMGGTFVTPVGTPSTLPLPQSALTMRSASTLLSSASLLTAAAPLGNDADAITPEIQNLANSLQSDPVRILEFVYNAIEYEHYFGSKKGAQLTLLEASGNDKDQCALLVALLRAAGYQPKYVTSYSLIPYDVAAADSNANPLTVGTGVSWLGLDPNPCPGIAVNPGDKPAGWTDDQFKKSFHLYNYFRSAGFPQNGTIMLAKYPGCIIASRTIVRLTIGTSSVFWDPSAKLLAGKDSLNLVTATNFNKENFLTAIGGTITDSYISGINSAAVQSQVSTATTSLLSTIKTTRPNDSVRDILGRKLNAQTAFSGFGDFYRVGGFFQADDADAIPTTLMSSLVLKIDSNAAYTILMPSLQGKRLSITSTGNTVQVWRDDSVIYSVTATAATYTLTMTAKHPHYANDGITPVHDANDGGRVYEKTGSYALFYGFAPSKRLLQSRQRTLDGYIEQVRAINPALVGADGAIDLPNLADATLKRQITTELLNIMGINWLYQSDQANQVAASINAMKLCMLHRFGRMGQEAGFYIDAPLQLSGTYPKNGLNDNAPVYALTFAYLSSALEHGIIDQYNLAANGSVSTVQILNLANASTDANKNRIYQATAANWSSIQSQLIGYGVITDTKSALYQFKAKVTAGSTLYIPRNASNAGTGWTWRGSGYVEFNPAAFTLGMIISGGYAGGYGVYNTYVNPAPVYSSYIASPNYFNTGSVSNVINRTTPSFNYPSYTAADPVDMATGAMIFDKEDLSLGQSGVRGLSFQRNYNSNRSNVDSSKLGYGWTHNYDMRAVVRTAIEAGLGETTPAEAAQILAAATIINELVKSNTSIKEMVAGALVAKVAIDNLLNNAVSLTMGKDNVQFIKQPDGTYTAPASSTMSLTKSGNFYLATERFGNTYKFDATQQGRIIEITDFFGKKLSFTYNANSINTITDAYGRVLTFGYVGTHIDNITDGTGRTVKFLYTGNDLTGVTDPESKTSTFGYDTKHRLTSLKDPQNRTIVVNRYDSEGRVYEQDSEGDPTKTWKLAFSGLRNTETNPLGGQTVYFYDLRGRPTAVQDPLGNKTRMVYDGQDHMIERWTAKNEIFKSKFNADHNVTESENPIGVKTIYRYDSLKRVDQVTVRDTDAATADRVTCIEYTAGNVSNLANKITDPKGNVTRRTYYTDGNLWTATEDSSTGNRTTTFLYDVRGMPRKTTYHDAKFEDFVYSVRGNLDSQTDRRGNTTSFLYNNRRQLTLTTQPGARITEREYDDSENLLSVTDPIKNVTRYTYSPTGKTKTETVAYGTVNAATTTHFYDVRDWKDYTLDPRNQKTDFGYDAAGRVTSIKDPLLHETTFQYDANGKRTLTRTPLGHETRLTYTALGLEDTMTDPANNVVDYGYNAYGERKNLKNRRDNTFEFFYDANGNPTITETPLNFAVTKTWNDRNLVGTVVKASTQTTTYVYDDVRRVYTQTDPVGTITFGYDNNGNPETVTESGNVLTRSWDALNRPQSYTNARNQSVGYQYYDNGLLWKLTYPGNRVVTYTYYPTNKLKTVVDWANRTTTYTWDTAGRLTNITRPNGVYRTNEFDNSNRLERIYERDSQGRLLVYFKYGFDDDGQITSRYRLPKPQPFTLPVNSALYDADNRLQTWNGQTVVHDRDGNMTSGPLGAAGFVSYNFDARNRLTSVGTVGSGFTYYGYDAENNRVSVTGAAGITKYLIDPHGDALPRVLIREKPDASTTTYVYGVGLLYEVNDTTGLATFYHFDNIGNTAALTGPTGTQTDRVEYSPYGQVTFRTGTTDTPFLYVGQLGVMQEANGLRYMRARYYSPELMRFINADPIGFAGGMNWYAYANGNPIMFSDPSGLVAWGDLGSATLGLVGNGLGFATGVLLGAVPEPTMITKVAAYAAVTKSTYGIIANGANFYNALVDAPTASTGSLITDVAYIAAPQNKTIQQAAVVADLATDLLIGRIGANHATALEGSIVRGANGFPLYDMQYQAVNSFTNLEKVSNTFTLMSLGQTAYDSFVVPGSPFNTNGSGGSGGGGGGGCRR
jgi:RHS repeat-associated protein